MRLIQTVTLEIVDFSTRDVPPYAILSHRWDETELTLQDMQREDRATLSGHDKVHACCKQAQRDGWTWVWIDSCCIDKSSSAELSEAINSMFEWYKEAEVCYTYLSDVFAGIADVQQGGQKFVASQWFTRGWTLQELLAPRNLIFYDHDWNIIGSRDDWQAVDPTIQLSTLIKEATGITSLNNWYNESVACKMSWAAKRSTTREEDRAYSLMGLFGVNMAPLYGEGPRAFHRLQLEILRENDDESIFAWIDRDDLSGGLLAPAISAFRWSGGIKQVEHPLVHSEEPDSQSYQRPPYTMTNRGLHFPGRPLLVPKSKDFESQAIVLVPLHCTDTRNGTGRLICIRLQRVTVGKSPWAKIHPHYQHTLSENEHQILINGTLQDWESFYVRQLGRYESPFQAPFSICLELKALRYYGYEYKGYSLEHAQLMKDQYSTEQTQSHFTLIVKTLLVTGLTLAFVFENVHDQRQIFLVLSIRYSQASIRILGPYEEDDNRTITGKSGQNWAIFDDFFLLSNWKKRDRTTVLKFETGTRIHAWLGRTWDGPQGYNIGFGITKAH